MSDDRTELREQLTAQMKRLGYDYTKLGKATGLARQTVAAALKGTGNTEQKTYDTLARVMDDIEADRVPGVKRYGDLDDGLFRIQMRGVFGVEEVIFEGSKDEAEIVQQQALEFLRKLRESSNNG